jgi:hypothetical protein
MNNPDNPAAGDHLRWSQVGLPVDTEIHLHIHVRKLALANSIWIFKRIFITANKRHQHGINILQNI